MQLSSVANTPAQLLVDFFSRAYTANDKARSNLEYVKLKSFFFETLKLDSWDFVAEEHDNFCR